MALQRHDAREHHGMRLRREIAVAHLHDRGGVDREHRDQGQENRAGEAAREDPDQRSVHAAGMGKRHSTAPVPAVHRAA
jgi:hypothetical protein